MNWTLRFRDNGSQALFSRATDMWCSQCQQDVPGVAANSSGICCARCHARLAPAVDAGNGAGRHQSSGEDGCYETTGKAPEQLLSDSGPPMEFDDWEFEDEVREVQRATQIWRLSSMDNEPAKTTTRSTDRPHSSVREWHVRHGRVSANSGKDKPGSDRRRRKAWWSWTVFLLGLTAFVCGGVLVGWSQYTGRGELWDIGLPLGLSGLAVLFIGVLFQLEGLWRSHDDTSETLDRLDDQLDELRHATATLGATHSDPPKLHLHLSDGASPRMLLADLQRQLDQLALQLADQRRAA